MWPLCMRSKAPAGEGVLWARGERNIIKTADFGIRCMERLRAAGDHVTVATVAQPSETWFDQQQAPWRHADVEVGAACSTTLHTTHSESAAVAGTVVRGYTALLKASTGVETTKRRGDVTPEDGAGAAESESEALGEPAAFVALPAEQRRSDVRYCAIKNRVLPKAIPVTGRTVTLTKEANRRLLYDLVVESGGQKTVSLLLPRVEASEGTRPYDPRTRSVDVQQQRRDFQDPLQVVTDCNTPSCKSRCEDSSSNSVLTGGCTLPLLFNTGQGGKTWNCQGRGSTEQNTDRAEAVAYELDGRRAENDRTDGVERMIPVSHVTEFKDLALDAALLQNLRVLGFRTPSPVQCALIPRALDGKNLIVQAKSGTGKTLAFALYLLHALTQRFKQRLVHLAASSGPAPPRTASQRARASRNAEGDGQRVFSDREASATENAQPLQKLESTFEPLSLSAAADADCIAMALVVTPTRELTIQVANEISRLGWRMRQPHLRHACFFGGRPLSVCHQQLAQKPHVLISTPGRLLGLLRSQTTRKAVAAWPCCCARAVSLHVVHSSHNGCKRSVEEQQLRSDKHTTSATPRGSTCDSRSNSEQDSEATSKEDKTDSKISQVLQSHSDEESCGDPATPAAGCDERLSLSRRLRQRLCIMVLDEADMLLGHFFRRQTKKLLSTILHPRLQLLATSATFPPPCINFLEQLCLSLDSEKQRGLCQHTALHEPLRCTKNCGTGQSQRMHEGTADRTASQAVEPLVAAAAFIRDHASAAAAADVRSAAVEVYLSNLVERPALARSASQDEVAECALECSSFERMLKAEAARSGAEKSLDADRSLAGSAMSNRAVQAVNSIIYQPLPHTVEKPRVFEKVMLCSSFVVHGADSGSTKCERVDSELTPWPTLDDLASAADSLFETCVRRKVRFQDSEKEDPTGALLGEESRVFCEIPDCNAAEEDGQRGCHFKQLNRTETKSVRAAAAIEPTEQSSEEKATVMNVQRQLEKSDRADEKGSLFTSYVSKRRDDACFTVESTPGETSLNEVSAVDVSGSSLTAANDFHPTEVTPEQSDVIKTYVPCPSVPYEIQRQSIKPAEEEETSVWRERAASRLTFSPPTENRKYSSGQMPGGSHFNAHKKRKTESPSLVGMKYVIMTVEDEPSLMRQLGAKVRALQHIFANLIFRQAMIFCNQAEAGAQIAACLIQLGIPTLYTSSKLTQEQRVRNLLALKRIDCRVFVCSDVMSRGIDAAAVDLVINLDVPRDKDIFLHRSGRAGRFGGNGVCVCIASKDEQPFFEYLAISLKLTVFPSPESLSRLQRERMPQRDGRGEEVVDDKKQENLFYRHIDCESGSQNTGNNEARQDVCAVLSEPVKLVREHIMEGRNFECGDARKPVPFADPDSSPSASEQRSVAGLPGPETSQAMIRRCCSGGAAMHAGGHVSDADPTGYQQRDALSASGRAGPDTCDRRQPGDSSSHLHAFLPSSFTDEARSRGESSRLCNYPSVQGNAERSIECVHLGDDVDGYYSINCATKDLIDRNETGTAASLQEGVYKTVGTDFLIPFGREGCTVTVRSSLVDFNIYASSPSSGMHLDACDVVQRGGSGCEFVNWSASLWGNASVPLQPYEHLLQQRRQAATFLSKNTSILSSLAATALCAHDRAFCDNAACPSASVIVSDGAWNAAHCERQISANPRRLSLTQATSIHIELQNMERRTSHVAAFTPEQYGSEPKTCGESFRVLFLEGAATSKEHVEELKDWKKRIPRQRRAGLGCTQIPAASCNNATAVGYALLHVKQTHAQFWENAEAMNVSHNK